MLLPYDPDMINIFKIILNTISIINYNEIKKNVNAFKNLLIQSCHFIKLVLLCCIIVR